MNQPKFSLVRRFNFTENFGGLILLKLLHTLLFLNILNSYNKSFRIHNTGIFSCTFPPSGWIRRVENWRTGNLAHIVGVAHVGAICWEMASIKNVAAPCIPLSRPLFRPSSPRQFSFLRKKPWVCKLHENDIQKQIQNKVTH